jgi:hypothetical protein
VFIITDKVRAKGGGRPGVSVSVMKDKELKLKEIEVSHTPGGSGEGRVQGRGCR